MEAQESESFEGSEDATNEGKTLHERRRKGSPLEIQVQNKKQKTEHAIDAQTTEPDNPPQEQDDAGLYGELQSMLDDAGLNEELQPMPDDASLKEELQSMPDNAWTNQELQFMPDDSWMTDEDGQPLSDKAWMAKWAHVPFTRFILNPRIVYPRPITHNVFDYSVPTLGGLPLPIAQRIFTHLDPPWQVCLALSCKAFGHVSYHVNQGNGLLYTRGERLRLLWCLQSWMGRLQKMCGKCEKYRPINPNYWKERRNHGQARTNSAIYGKSREDFKFNSEDCPECTAEELWNRSQSAHHRYLSTIWA